jgi:hypothetical protein
MEEKGESEKIETRIYRRRLDFKNTKTLGEVAEKAGKKRGLD